jgi:hypothetical protein
MTNNGETYNYRELRVEPEANGRGYPQVTKSLARTLSRSLSAYLCGTAAARRRRDGLLSIAACTEAHAGLPTAPKDAAIEIGAEPWQPVATRARKLAGTLHTALAHEDFLALIVYGSQARGCTTAFSDVDAVLVISDPAAESRAALRSLRPRVLAAQCAVLDYQSMQHHGFEVVTPRLLRAAGAALEMPAVALVETRSVVGGPVTACFAARDRLGDPQPLRRVVGALAGITSWPAHPWALHGVVSMFELVPALYLQARGRAVAKAESFATAREEFGASWWPYDRLNEVRQGWPVIQRPWLGWASRLLRNPWLTVAGWRRLPDRAGATMHRLLDPESLDALQRLVVKMEAATR